MDDSGRTGFVSRFAVRRLFAVLCALILVALAISLSFAVRSRLLDQKLVTVGDAIIMTMCLSVVLYLVTQAVFGRLASGPAQLFSDSNVPPPDLWDEELDAVVYGPPFQSDATTEDFHRFGRRRSMRRSEDFMRDNIGPTHHSDCPRSYDLVEKLREINLHGPDLTLVELGATNLRGADLRGANLSRIDLSWARFCLADFRESNLHGTLFVGADLSLADFREANLSRAKFGQANLREAVLRWVDLRWADLTGADLCGANLERAMLHGANLRGANLRLASMHATSFGESDLSEADLRGADIRGANLGGARGLVQKQINATTGDDTTILPQGLAHPRRWAKTVFE